MASSSTRTRSAHAAWLVLMVAGACSSPDEAGPESGMPQGGGAGTVTAPSAGGGGAAGGNAGASGAGGAAGTSTVGSSEPPSGGAASPDAGTDAGIGPPFQPLSPAPLQLLAGETRTCAMREPGRLTCWGGNLFGELGYGDIEEHRGDQPEERAELLPALELGASARVVALSIGSAHNCVALESGEVECWGDNTNGELGLPPSGTIGDEPGEMGDALQPVPLGRVPPVVALASGAQHTCAVFEDGTLKCWGYNAAGQLGIGDSTDRGHDPAAMGDPLPFVDLGTGRRAIAVAAGLYHSCALLDDQSVKCWGVNIDGQLGQGHARSIGDEPGEMGDALPPVDLGTAGGAIALTSGNDHVCALLGDHRLKCWGKNMFGELGLGDTISRGDGPDEMGDALPAVDLGPGHTAAAVSGGNGQTCALRDDGRVLCWGAGDTLGLGDTETRGDEAGEMGDALPPIDLGADHGADTITLGNGHCCARLLDGTARCWGINAWGELGLGDAETRGDEPGEMGSALPALDLW